MRDEFEVIFYADNLVLVAAVLLIYSKIQANPNYTVLETTWMLTSKMQCDIMSKNPQMFYQLRKKIVDFIN